MRSDSRRTRRRYHPSIPTKKPSRRKASPCLFRQSCGHIYSTAGCRFCNSLTIRPPSHAGARGRAMIRHGRTCKSARTAGIPALQSNTVAFPDAHFPQNRRKGFCCRRRAFLSPFRVHISRLPFFVLPSFVLRLPFSRPSLFRYSVFCSSVFHSMFCLLPFAF